MINNKEAYEFIVQELNEPMTTYFRNLYNIKRNPDGTKMNAGKCFNINYSAFDYPNKDLVIFVTAASEA